MRTVLVETSDGLVRDVIVPANADGTYFVINWDSLLGDLTNPAETKATWDQFAPEIKKYIYDRYPEDWQKIQAEIRRVESLTS